jgi:hypothetical protein
MPIVYDKLLALKIPEVTQAYTEKDAILYALGVGLGRDPMDADDSLGQNPKSSKRANVVRFASRADMD